MIYKLSHFDYINLWLLLTPDKIQDRFKEHSHSVRHIYRIYSLYHLSHINHARQALLEQILHSKPIFVTDKEVEETFMQILLEEKECVCDAIDNKIQIFEETWKN